MGETIKEAIMLDIATPHLTQAEWRDVKSALVAVADCGCAETRNSTSLWPRVGRSTAITSRLDETGAAPVPDLASIRDFLCETGRSHRLAERHVPALSALGFNRAQIEALALLGA
jgi:hypothetical protein